MTLRGIARVDLPDQPLLAESVDSRHFDSEDRLSFFERSVYGDCTGYFGQPRLLGLSASNDNAFVCERIMAHNLYASHLRTSGYVARVAEGADSELGEIIYLNLILDGQAEVRCRSGTKRINQGDIYINAVKDHQITFSAGHYQRIIFPKSLIDGLGVAREDFLVQRRNDVVTPIVRSAIEFGATALKSGDEKQTQLATNMAASILKALLQEARRPSRSFGYDHIRDKAIAYIRENLHRVNLTVAEVASYVHVSRATLYRAFESVGGLKDFIMSERIALAKSKLRAGRVDRGFVTAVAYDVGFSSPEHFSKVFKARSGMTPTQFIKSGLA